ncbi:hypothetical protein QR680_010058 [Steinernema hermaphroditum]|uniref:Uncharacterized protein n=1 Tax=Steinernema hermaphroditum TaxID=289476 RepID=A0AA39IMK7_9BILA|nr:hypothetical protein QR680_010058 [Steinernema hermaphroditum]
MIGSICVTRIGVSNAGAQPLRPGTINEYMSSNWSVFSAPNQWSRYSSDLMFSYSAILLLCLLALSESRAPKKSIDEVAKEVDNIAKKLAELSKFKDINDDLKLIDEVVQAVHYWNYFKDHLQQPAVFQKAGYELAHQFTVLRDNYLQELNSLPCPLTNDFVRKSENTTTYFLTNAETLIFSMHKDSHKIAHDKCHFGTDPYSWTHNVKYIDTEHVKKSLDITDKRFCTEEQRKEVGPKVAQLEFTVYMLVMKICYEDHYKGNPETITNYRNKQSEVFRQYLPKLKSAV